VPVFLHTDLVAFSKTIRIDLRVLSERLLRTILKLEVFGRKRGGFQVAREAGQQKKPRKLYAMLSKKTVQLPLSLWNLTPDPTPVHSPASSVDGDTEDEVIMDSRPLSVAIPAFCAMRPTLDEVLSNTAPYPYTLGAFMAYLSTNHCLETLEFTTAAKRYGERYRTVSRQIGESPIYSECQQTQQLRMLWQRLLNAYVIPGSPREINLSYEVRDRLLEYANADAPPQPEILEPALRRMHDLMEESIFIPFLNSLASSAHILPSEPPPDLDDRPNQSNSSLDEPPLTLRRAASRSRRVSPQSSMDFASQRYPIGVSTRTFGSLGRAGSRLSTTSGDSGSPTLTDDSGVSMLPNPGVEEPMTPPTTPPSGDLNPYPGYSPKSKGDNPFKKMGMKLGFKKKSGSRDLGFPGED